ncbi:pyridoxamine 5'-phosphate oxidase [Amycolatopsis mediterranei S699]|uniref:Pyridoxamine 5'-phosphate oxidase n=2 Tax=Amycolatopsis mediterranei TaxID=33910 RepID=A0A0H3DI67_AMYMU|nr:PPOX class F420-dependent oxidoreductase [Amycolatopsis mediterranei]ADJ50376.1 pyridoxamine 5'-phosphate oxidase [Amycolatopsis mediterranei U32]AEK47377.1 pyridoxamine 5'-phosphate oxidase [Amycolatopsis mediterranei S699]AFO82082.1 pyridoxamine 5'-phosphate oxidase [Amycolatopsis mediterranei S699]AGT89211.1 pyridoxamine 5'-phosphate oxidase [Amycolatopsis mediterranei RB]KDO08238.1 pyridoxamine 5'-phosphate oxidase [Amycolatopsis mediterranei]
MPLTLSDEVRALVDGKNFATVATLDPDGGPQTSVVWIALDDGDLVFSATEDRRKVRNLRRDPRISVSITDVENPYRHTQLRGTVTITPDPGKTLPKTLSHKYLAQDPPPEGPETERVIVRLKVDKVAGNVK